MKLKTLKINGTRTEEFQDVLIEDNKLYPDNTKRIVISYFLFPKKLNGEKRRGLQIVEQKSFIDIADPRDFAIHYNLWKDERFMDYNR